MSLIVHLRQLLILATVVATWPGFAYDPLASAAPGAVTTLDLTVSDASRRREIPVRVYLPGGTPKMAPVVLFSHGLGGSREGGHYLGQHWAGMGYVAVFLQHPGSDEGVWREQPLARRRTAMVQAASAQNLILRVQDVFAALDQLAVWNRAADHPLAGRPDLARVALAGHSFGAVTAQAVGGQSFLGRAPFADPRIKAIIAMSPSRPRQGTPENAFGSIKLPWLLLTGTKDDGAIVGITVADRLAVFPALPPGGKYESVLHEAEHGAFTERPLPGEKRQRNPNHHRAVLALTTAFLDAYLREDGDARAWLDGDGPSTVLEANDRWQRK